MQRPEANFERLLLFFSTCFETESLTEFAAILARLAEQFAPEIHLSYLLPTHQHWGHRHTLPGPYAIAWADLELTI